jgi:phosphogluconate dehydratase
LLHEDVQTVFGTGLAAYATEPALDAEGHVRWVPAAEASGDETVLRGIKYPFQLTGGLRVLDGELGRAVIKTSAVAPERHVIEAPARIFHDQEAVHAAFKAGELNQDTVVVVRFQGPKANGMPELHRLMPPLGVLQDRGYKIALVTDGRMSGASGKVPSAIHVTPEAADGGPIAKLRDGDIVRVDGRSGRLTVLVDPQEWAARDAEVADLTSYHFGTGRELFGTFRSAVSRADTGATIFAGLAA